MRALQYGGADDAQHANDTIVTFAMIETAQALDKLDDILSVEGLDAIYIGPSDLSLAPGCTPTFGAQQVMAKMRAAPRKNITPVGGNHDGQSGEAETA